MSEQDDNKAEAAPSAAMQARKDDSLIAPFLSYSVRLGDLADCLRLMTEDRARAALRRAQWGRTRFWDRLPSYEELMRLPPREDVSPDGPCF